MKELLRISHGMQDDLKEDSLRDYCLEIYEGDILYIQGIAGSGIRTLVNVLAGDCVMKRGELYLWEERVKDFNRNTACQYQIYTITAEKDLVETLTVAENLEAVRSLKFSGKYYDRQRVERAVSDYLEKEQVQIFSSASVWTLSQKDRKKLSILKAKMQGARLIVLDASGDLYEGQEAEELCRIIQKANEEGITFAILSECYTAFAQIASRIQLLSQGRDRREWQEPDEEIRKKLRGPFLAGAYGAGMEKSHASRSFIGMFDYEWEMENCFWNYLAYVKEHNRALWDAYIGADIPKAGISRTGDTVVIPRDSADRLLNNLSVADNLIMTIPKRVGSSSIGVINGSIRKSVAEDFYRKTGIDAEAVRVEDLNYIQRKLLSVCRFELERPKFILLESPYGGMNLEETGQLRSHLEGLCKKGIRVLYFSKSMEELCRDCGSVIVTENGKSAKISTF